MCENNFNTITVTETRSLVINAPSFFEDGDFIEWLKNDSPKFTWFNGEITEWSDVVVCVDPSLNGEGSESDMPEHIWSQIIDACIEHIGPNRSSNHYLVKLTNL